MRVFTFMALISLSLTASATTTVTGQRALGILEAFRTMGVYSMPKSPAGELQYQQYVYCTREMNSKVDNTDPSYMMNIYKCEIGVSKVIGARAKVLFDGAASTFGMASKDGVDATGARILDCRIVLAEADLNKRFTCSFQ